MYLLLVVLISSLASAEQCICALVNSQILENNIQSWCVSMNISAFCLSGQYTGVLDKACYASKKDSQNDINKMPNMFYCYYSNSQISLKDPNARNKILGFFGFLILLLCCGLGCFVVCGVLLGVLGVGILFLGKNKRIMNWMAGRFLQTEYM